MGYETLLGEKLPRPPADVPQLPESVPADRAAAYRETQFRAAVRQVP